MSSIAPGLLKTGGQGIQKICDECREIGAELPAYELVGTTLRIRFQALDSARIGLPKAPKTDGVLEGAIEDKILDILKEAPDISKESLGKRLGTTRRVIQKNIKILKAAGRIERVDRKRYGHWEVY